MVRQRTATFSSSDWFWSHSSWVLQLKESGEKNGWLKKCYYGLGRCRKSCKEEEKKKEKCGKTLSCCLLSKNAKLSDFSPKPVTGEKWREREEREERGREGGGNKK
uniref:Beta-defensin n=1 Tax=Spermophilus dauricus TaxID=99837 RepID=A0A8C9PHA0_SPEDA